MGYNPESYWDHVAERIKAQGKINVLAGDNEPYYRYKRKLFLKLLNMISFKNRKVLEVGSGPGGNLAEILKQKPAVLAGADISDRMIEIASKQVTGLLVQIKKFDGGKLPFSDNTFDIVFTATVLQHVTDDTQVQTLIQSMCKVSASEIYIFERIEKKKKVTETNAGRTVNEYTGYFNTCGYSLSNSRFLHIEVSYFVCGAIRKIFNSKKRREGEKVSPLSVFLQKLVLPVTSLLDKIIKRKRDLAMLHFKKTGHPGV